MRPSESAGQAVPFSVGSNGKWSGRIRRRVMPHLATVAAKASASWPPAERRTPDFESLSLTAV